MTTIGQDIAKAIRDVSRETNATMARGIDVLEQAGKAVGYLAFATDNLAKELKHTRQPSHDPDDEEPSRRPFSAWPKMNSRVEVR